MSITVSGRKALWSLSGCLCAICQIPLVQPSSVPSGAPVIIGEECHIVAQKNLGPRGNSLLTTEERDRYENLILLCPTHHALIDSDVVKYTVEVLQEIKVQHEKQMKIRLSKDWDEHYQYFILQWENLCRVDSWQNFTADFYFQARHYVSEKFIEGLEGFCDYFQKVKGQFFFIRIDLNIAFVNFINIYRAFNNLLMPYCKLTEGGYALEKFYKQQRAGRTYDELAQEYDEVSKNLNNLIAELTRAGNHIIDTIRLYLNPNYRLATGYLMIEVGDILRRNTYVPFYKDENLSSDFPFSSLQSFKSIVNSRDYYY